MVDNTKFGVEIKVDADEAIKKLMVLSAVMKQFANTAQKETNTASTSFSNMGFSIKNALNALGITLAGLSFSNLITGALKASAELESAAISFEVFTGSAEVAKQLMEEFKAVAIKSPMQFQDIVQGGKTLMAYGITAQQVIPLVKMLGDVSGGNADKFNRLSLAFGQVNAVGRLMSAELRQMVQANFNPLQAIANKTGESMDSLSKRLRAGQISVREVAEAFMYATQKGGQFYGNAEKQSQTLLGAYNKLSEGLKFTLAEIGDNIARTFDLRGAAETASVMFGLLAINFKNINVEGAKSAYWSEALKTSLRDVALVLDLAIKGFMFLGQVIETISGPIDSLSNALDNFVISVAGTFGKKVQDTVKGAIDYVNNFGKESEKVAKQKSPFQKLKEDYEAFIKSFKDKPSGITGDEETKAERNRFAKLSQLAREGYTEVNKHVRSGFQTRLEIFDEYAREELRKYKELGINTSNIEKNQFKYRQQVAMMETAKLTSIVNKGFSLDNIRRSLSEMVDVQVRQFERIGNVIKTNIFGHQAGPAGGLRLEQLSDNLKAQTGYMTAAISESESALATYGASMFAAQQDFKMNILSGFGEMAGGLMSGAIKLKDGFDFMIRMLLNAAGDFLIQAGTTAIKLGLAKSAIEASLSALGPAAIPVGVAAIAAGTALKNMAKNMVGDTAQGINNATKGIVGASGRTTGASFAYGGASYATQSIKLQIDLTGAITASPTGYNINKSLETVLRVTGRE